VLYFRHSTFAAGFRGSVPERGPVGMGGNQHKKTCGEDSRICPMPLVSTPTCECVPVKRRSQWVPLCAEPSRTAVFEECRVHVSLLATQRPAYPRVVALGVQRKQRDCQRSASMVRPLAYLPVRCPPYPNTQLLARMPPPIEPPSAHMTA